MILDAPNKHLSKLLLLCLSGMADPLSVVCLGLHLARTELRLATACFFRAFPAAKMSSLEGMSESDMEPEMIAFTEPKGHRCLIECS